MSKVAPIYTPENCKFSAPLQWGLSVFWRVPPRDDESPESVALGFLNNLAYVHGMRPIYQYGAFTRDVRRVR